MAITLSEAENNCKQGIRNLSGRVDLALGILCVSDILIQFSAILILVFILILIVIINILLILIINLILILTRSSICFLFRLSFSSLGTGRTPGTRTLGWRSFLVYSVYSASCTTYIISITIFNILTEIVCRSPAITTISPRLLPGNRARKGKGQILL